MALTERPADWSSDKWATPWDEVRQFGVFDLDPCCEVHTAKAPVFYTEGGLEKPWFGKVWCNPPYSDPLPWCRRAAEATASGEAELVVMLLPVSTDTRWFHEWVLPHAEIQYKRGRIRFLGWMGTPIGSPRAPSMFAIYRSQT